jgi:hypothetical protein
MTRKLMPLLAIVLVAGIGTLGLNAKQTSAPQTPAVQAGVDRSAMSVEMMSHQRDMQSLSIKLADSFQAVGRARDGEGYVKDMSIVKAHETDIKALQKSFREHRQFLKIYEHKCDVNSKQLDVMIQHQQAMKAMLYDVVESYDTFEITNEKDPNDSVTEYIRPAFEKHRAALQELTTVIAEHEQAVAHMVKSCNP